MAPVVLFTQDRIYEIDGIKFHVKPEEYDDFLYSMSDIRKKGDGLEDGVGNLGIGAYQLLRRITSWEGAVLEDGSPAPCTDEAKRALFGQMPNLLNKLFAAISEYEASVRKNLTPSPDMSPGTDQM